MPVIEIIIHHSIEDTVDVNSVVYKVYKFVVTHCIDKVCNIALRKVKVAKMRKSGISMNLSRCNIINVTALCNSGSNTTIWRRCYFTGNNRYQKRLLHYKAQC